jgi:hypothetical protein
MVPPALPRLKTQLSHLTERAWLRVRYAALARRIAPRSSASSRTRLGNRYEICSACSSNSGGSCFAALRNSMPISRSFSPRRIYDLRSTYASQSLAAGVSVFELAGFMGTTVKMIERRYGKVLQGAGAASAAKLDAYLDRLGQEQATAAEGE